MGAAPDKPALLEIAKHRGAFFVFTLMNSP